MERKRISRRLPHWDYSQNGLYFVTFCTHARTPLLGTVESAPDPTGLNARFNASDLGLVCMDVPGSVQERYPHASIVKLTVMPDHVHALIALNGIEDGDVADLGSIIFSFKKKVTVQARHLGFQGKLWQANYYDHIVRNEPDVLRIMKYMEENPLKWALGKHDAQEEVSASFLDSKFLDIKIRG